LREGPHSFPAFVVVVAIVAHSLLDPALSGIHPFLTERLGTEVLPKAATRSMGAKRLSPEDLLLQGGLVLLVDGSL
jgi:hypothetical protein